MMKSLVKSSERKNARITNDQKSEAGISKCSKKFL